MLVLVVLGGCGRDDSSARPPADGREPPPKAAQSLVTADQRAAALRAAQVWAPPAIGSDKLDLRANPPGPGAWNPEDTIECRLVVKPMGGTTPKFDCELGDGDVVRVKYGRGNAELYAEVAATRLLAALGFGADRMYVVKQVRCAGCTEFPFHALRCLDETGLQHVCFPGGVNYSGIARFDHVVVERRLEGRRIESTPDQGWAWYELDNVNPAASGAPRAHVDALKLLAVFIAHWDNKSENQRLLCLPGGDLPDGGCSRPFAILQDLGASFGPTKLDLQVWRSTGVWTDPRACRVSMEHLPWGGGTFPEQPISEEGRRFLLERLDQLSRDQIGDLFAGARIEEFDSVSAEARQPKAWAAAFLDKVRQIREAGPCPEPPQRARGSGPRT